MRLLSIEGRDFLSYPRLELDVSDIPHAAIVGRNGAGKSAILDAILWCLYGQGRGSTDEMIREGAVDCYVRTTWLRKAGNASQVVTITRSRSKVSEESSLMVMVDHEDRSATRIPETQARIERLMGMRYKALLAGPVMVQGQSGAILQAKPAEATDLLVELFGLERWQAYHEEAKARKDEIDRDAKRLEQDISEYDEALRDTDMLGYQRELREFRENLPAHQRLHDELATDLQEARTKAAILQDRAKRAEALEREVQAALLSLTDLQTRKTRLAETIERARKTVTETTLPTIPPEPSTEELDDLRVAGEADLRAIADLQAERRRVPDLERRLAAAVAASREGSPCEGEPPGCRYLVLAQEQGDIAVGLQVEIDRIAVATMSLEAISARADKREGKIRELQNVLTQQRRDREDVVSASAGARAKVEAAQQYMAEHVTELDGMDAKITDADAIHKAKVKERLALQQDEFAMAELAETITTLTAAARSAMEQLEACKQGIITTEQLISLVEAEQAKRQKAVDALAAIAEDRKTYTELAKHFHRTGIPTDILDEALPEVEKRANEILRRLPDDYSIRIDTTVATKSQTFKNELRVVVMRAGRERAYHMLSGGQRFRVEFAVRIALAAVIAERVDATVDTLWLDEPLGPLDREGQEAVSDTLNAVRDDFGFIGVVSHVADFNDRFEHRIEVTMEDDESVAVVR